MIPLPALLQLAGVVAGLALLLAAIGIGALRALRGRPISWMLAVVVAITVLATLAGVVTTAAFMFISTHDRTVMFLLVAAAAIAGLGVAGLLARHVAGSSRALGLAVRRAAETGTYEPPREALPGELAELSAELEAAYHRLATAAERERALEASRRELVAWVSHDLRTPLAGLRAMAESLVDEVVADPATVSRYHAQMRGEVDRLTDMVNDLFELARIHSGALLLSRRRVGLDALLADTLASADPLATAKGVRLSGHVPSGLPIEVDTDEFGRALRNLVINAIRHTPSDRTVEVVGSEDGGMACVMVCDECGGIPDEDLPRVFDVAFRGSSARTPNPHQGAGLGLAIVRGIVEAHSGEVGVSNAEHGCRFEVRIPLTSRSAAAG